MEHLLFFGTMLGPLFADYTFGIVVMGHLYFAKDLAIVLANQKRAIRCMMSTHSKSGNACGMILGEHVQGAVMIILREEIV